jgi:hypothetical protein
MVATTNSVVVVVAIASVYADVNATASVGISSANATCVDVATDDVVASSTIAATIADDAIDIAPV